jgi:hypothetical protein
MAVGCTKNGQVAGTIPIVAGIIATEEITIYESVTVKFPPAKETSVAKSTPVKSPETSAAKSSAVGIGALGADRGGQYDRNRVEPRLCDRVSMVCLASHHDRADEGVHPATSGFRSTKVRRPVQVSHAPHRPSGLTF